LSIIGRHIEKIRSEPVTERELTKAKNQKLRELVTDNLTVNSKARTLGWAAVDVGDVSEVNRQIEDTRKVTQEDLLRVAAQYLRPDRVLKVTVERNPLGTAKKALFDAQEESETAVTAEPEKVAHPRALARPQQFPSEPPFAPITAPKLTLNYMQERLSNGLKVIVVPNHEVPFVTVRLGLLAGAWTEQKPGTASMAMQMLTKGTTKHSEAQLADELDTCAISISGHAGMDTSGIHMSCLISHIDRAMGLLAMLPTFPPVEFEKLRKQVLTSLAVRAEEPDYIADRQLRRVMYGNHFYSRTAVGEIEDVNALTVQDLKPWYEKFARPDMAVLIFAGDIEPQRAFELAQKTFGSWKPALLAPTLTRPEIASPVMTTGIS